MMELYLSRCPLSYWMNDDRPICENRRQCAYLLGELFRTKSMKHPVDLWLITPCTLSSNCYAITVLSVLKGQLIGCACKCLNSRTEDHHGHLVLL